MHTLPYKEYQQLYDLLVTEHTDDFSLMEYIEDEELVDNAIKYFEKAEFPLIYPAKSYAVAIIYAFTLCDRYNLPVRTILNDKDLFLGQDPYFVPYENDPDTYERIIEEDVKKDAMVVAWSIYQLATRDDLLPRMATADMPPKPPSEP